MAPIGSGSSARVFLADDTTLKRRVAVKVLHAALADDEVFLRRFRLEAQAAGALNHPHIMSVYDWGEDDVPFIVSEFLGGGSLRGMLDTGHLLTPSQALLVALEAARGLEYAHRRGLVHRDIKPANLLFDDEARLRIGDFGLARALAESAWTEPSGVMLGTMRYASPEQAKGEALSGKSDVYSLALVLVEAVTGELPFVADTALGTLMARVDQQLRAPESMGPLGPVVERATDPDPARRPDAGELVVALMAAAEELTRPEPLPLAGAIARGDADVEVRDPTLISPSEILTTPHRVDVLSVQDLATSTALEPVGATTTSVPTLTPRRDRRADAVVVPLEDDDEAPRGRWPVVLGVLLVVAMVAAGVMAYLAAGPGSATVPDLRARSEDEVKELAARNDWSLVRQENRDEDVAAGQVIGTDPAAGATLAEGGVLTYVISIGKPLVPVPPVAGKALAEARQLLTDAGFTVGEPVRAFDEQQPKEAVVALRDAAGKDVTATAPRGSAVVPLVSDGAKPRAIPAGLEGQDRDAVVTAINQLRLSPQLSQAFSDTVPAGKVISVAPVAGTQVEVNTPVQVVVSQGPAPRAVPSVAGLTVAVATERLVAAGFKVSGVTGDPSRPVLATDPPAGETQPFGREIRIITRAS